MTTETVAEDPITSVAWTQRGTMVSVGTTNGDVQVWDATKCKKVRSMSGHQARVGANSIIFDENK